MYLSLTGQKLVYGQIFEGAIALPRSGTFYEQQTFYVSLLTKLSINSVSPEKFVASHFTSLFE